MSDQTKATQWIDFNVNHKVRVKLTERGHAIHLEQHEALRRAIPKLQYRAPSEDVDGWSEWQLWELMHTFGQHCSLGLTLPFETVIQIPATGERK